MNIRINNTTTKFEVWVNIYLAYFFFEIFKFFNRKEPHFAQQVKLEMKVYDIKKADRILWTLKFYYSILCHMKKK